MQEAVKPFEGVTFQLPQWETVYCTNAKQTHSDLCFLILSITTCEPCQVSKCQWDHSATVQQSPRPFSCVVINGGQDWWLHQPLSWAFHFPKPIPRFFFSQHSGQRDILNLPQHTMPLCQFKLIFPRGNQWGKWSYGRNDMAWNWKKRRARIFSETCVQ